MIRICSMRYFFVIAGAVLPVVGLVNDVSAQEAPKLVLSEMAALDGPETRTMKAMIRGIEFITQNSTLEYAGEALPDVIVVTEGQLQLRAYSPEVLIAATKEDRPLDRVSAFYDQEANQIFLADPNSIEGPTLIHELVHFLQNINSKNDTFADHRMCLEAEAYDLQSAWQTEQGVDLARKPDYGFLMTLYGACNDADFSWVKSADIRSD
jgi:hypothetical protein